ncbi:MAG: nucleosidase [Marmoricola sp.]
MSTLVVSATPEEAAHVPAGLPVVITGVGKTRAAAVLARALTGTPGVDHVVNIGTAGALRDGMTGLHLPGAVFNHELSADALRQLGYDPMEWLEIAGGSDVVLASGDVFVTDAGVRSRLAEAAHLVDMEGYAVSWTCHHLGVPVRLVKHVSDNADAAAMSWPEVVDASAQVLGDWLRDNVS